MIRGAIESVTHNRIHGWIWSPDGILAGRTVLAFLDDHCIGAGTVAGFRPDLKEAGLGDGVAGFDFDLSYPKTVDAARIVIRLDGSDAVLLQRRARVMPTAAGASLRPARSRPSLGALQWMRARGWLSKAEVDFLLGFRQAGAQGRALPLTPDSAAPLPDPLDAARSLLQLERMDEGAIRRETVATPREWRRLAEEQEIADGPGAAIALWSPVRATLPILEGSHLKPPVIGADAVPPAVDHDLGPDRLLLIDGRTMLGTEAAFPPGGIDAFYLAA